MLQGMWIRVRENYIHQWQGAYLVDVILASDSSLSNMLASPTRECMAMCIVQIRTCNQNSSV